MAYIGFSLSFCVRDIARGVIPLAEVIGIKTATAVTTPEGWDSLFKEYRETYWSADPDACEKIARKLLAAEGIIQPRLEDQPVHNISAGRWERDGHLIGDAELRAMYHDHDLLQSTARQPTSAQWEESFSDNPSDL
jgi:hypothetical protein